MSENSELWEAHKQASQTKRANNRANSATALREANICYETKNGGAHLIVKHDGVVVDFWPGTGKWIVRGGKTGRGVFKLLDLLK